MNNSADFALDTNILSDYYAEHRHVQSCGAATGCFLLVTMWTVGHSWPTRSMGVSAHHRMKSDVVVYKTVWFKRVETSRSVERRSI